MENYDHDTLKYKRYLEEEIRRSMILKLKDQMEQSFIGNDSSVIMIGEQTAIDITGRAPKGVIEYLDFEPELVIRVISVSDITQLSHDIHRSVAHGVHLKYERHQNYLDIYFEKAQDFVLVKMFAV